MSLYELITEKHSSVEIALIEWNPKIDLLALATKKGDLIIQRLFWRKAWHVPHLASDVAITALAWAWNGRWLAAAYSNGLIRLYEVELGEVLHEFTLDPSAVHGRLSCLSWGLKSERCVRTVEMDRMAEEFNCCHVPKLLSPNVIASNPTPKPSALELHGLESKIKDIDTEMDILWIGTSNGHIFCYAYGFFRILSAVLSPAFSDIDHQPSSFPVHSIANSASFDRLCTVWRSNQDKISTASVGYAVYDTTPLRLHKSHIRRLCHSLACIRTCERNISATLRTLQDTWEDTITELDRKFAGYAKELWMREGDNVTVGDELLNVLAVGSASDEFEEFLLHKIGEKGIKSMTVSIDHVYSTIKRLIGINLRRATHALFQHCVTLGRTARGKTSGSEERGLLTSRNEVVSGLKQAVGALILKLNEMEARLDASHALATRFFSWLKIMISLLVTKALPDSTKAHSMAFTSKDLKFIKDIFMQPWSESKCPLFRLDEIGQYLVDGPLSHPVETSEKKQVFPDMLSEVWNDSNAEGSAVPDWVFQAQPSSSLVQAVKAVQVQLEACVADLSGSGLQPMEIGRQILTQFPVQTTMSPNLKFQTRFCMTTGNVQSMEDSNSATPLPLFTILLNGLPRQISDRFMTTIFVNARDANLIGGVNFVYDSITTEILDMESYSPVSVCLLLKRHACTSETEDTNALQSRPTAGELYRTNQHSLALFDYTAAMLKCVRDPKNFKNVTFQADRVIDGLETVDMVASLSAPEVLQSIPNAAMGTIHINGHRKTGCFLYADRNHLRLVFTQPGEGGNDSGTAQNDSNLSNYSVHAGSNATNGGNGRLGETLLEPGEGEKIVVDIPKMDCHIAASSRVKERDATGEEDGVDNLVIGGPADLDADDMETMVTGLI